jgi:hypothetical protein
LDTNLLKQFGKVLSREKARFNQRIAVFAFFLIVATILWYLNKLSYEYDTVFAYPCRFENLPKGKVMIGEPPQNLKLGVKAFGYTLLRYKLVASISPITIDLSLLPLYPVRGSDVKFFITASRMRAAVISQLRGELQLLSILPDTIYFEFTNLVFRKVPVKTNLTFSCDRQHMIAGSIKTEPDSVIISGPQTLIDTINFINTATVRAEKLTSTEEKSIPLTSFPQIGLSHRRVVVTIPVEKFTEASINIPVDVRNLPRDQRLILMPRAINLKCNVPLSHYSKLNSRHFDAYVDFNSVGLTPGNKLRVNVLTKDLFINNLDFEPKYVEFIIEKL